MMNVNGTYLLWGNWLLGGLMQFLNGLLVVPKVLLASNEDNRKALAEMENFRDPLVYHHASADIYKSPYTISKSDIGGTFSCTLSRESGESMAKQMRMTCESGYERGRRRS
jgi:hypothetical protein